MAIFFTSDTHFGDHRTLNLYKRPFTSVAAMDEGLAANWNGVVGGADEVWHLGDFARNAQAARLLPRLNGRKHLVSGNNDPPEVRALSAWSSVQAYKELDIGGILFVLCHYPFRSWNRMHRGAVNLHGHSHGRMKPFVRQFDVGVDAWALRPVSLQEILARV